MKYHKFCLVLMFLVGLIVVLPSTFADTFTSNHTGVINWDDASAGGDCGMKLVANESITITMINFSWAAGKVLDRNTMQIKFQNGTLIQSWYRPAGYYYVNVSIDIPASSNFSIVFNTTAEGDCSYDDSAESWPQTNKHITWLKGIYNGALHTSAWAITNITYITGGSSTPPGAGTLLLNLTYPTNNTFSNNNNYNFSYTPYWLNTTINSCELWGNFTGLWSLNQSNITIVNNVSVNNFTGNIKLDDGVYIWNVNCNNGTNNWANDNYTLVVDVSNPILSATTFVNNSVYFRNNISAQFNITDNILLHSYNISIDGTSVQGNNSIDQTSLSISLNYNTTNLSVGVHTLNFTFADGHTANELIDANSFEPYTGLFNNYLRFDFKEPYKKGYLQLEQKAGSIFDKWSTEKKKDRYSFNFEPSALKDSYTFTVKADSDIYIVNAPGTEYDKWLIYDSHWLDFYPYKDLEFKKLSNNEIEVTIRGVDPKLDKLSFYSAGDLNIVTYMYNFTITNATLTYTNPVAELSNQIITFNINKTGGILGTNATLVWNNTYQTVTKTEYSIYDNYVASFLTPDLPGNVSTIYFQWYYNVSSLALNESGMTNTSQSVTGMFIDNCSTYNITVLNMTGYTEATNPYSIFNTSINAYVELWSNATNKTSFNITFGGTYSYRWCIYDPNQTYNIYSQMEYTGTSNDGSTYLKETYYLHDINVSNATQFVNLYNTPNGTYVQFTVTDQDDNPISGLYINILKYDLATNSYITTEILKTDDKGQALGTIILNTQFYKFLLTYNGNVVFTSDANKIISTTRNFRVSISSDYFDRWDTYNNITTLLTFNNATRNYAYTFLNPTGSTVEACLYIYKEQAMAETLVNSSCVTASAGTILLNIGSNYIGYNYLAKGSIHINPTMWDFLSASFDTGYETWGKDGIFLTFFVRIAMAMIGLWNPIIAIILLVLSDFGMMAMGLFKLNWETFIVYVAMAGIIVWRLSNRK